MLLGRQADRSASDARRGLPQEGLVGVYDRCKAEFERRAGSGPLRVSLGRPQVSARLPVWTLLSAARNMSVRDTRADV